MKNLILTLIITLPLTVLGQGWEQTYDFNSREEGYSVDQTQDGGFIVVGSRGNWSEMIMIKTNNNGLIEWYKTFGDTTSWWDMNSNEIVSFTNLGCYVKQSSDGGYVIVGVLNDEFSMIKTDNLGNEQWVKTYPNHEFGGIYINGIQEINNGFVMKGYYNGDPCLIKTDNLGNEIWTQSYPNLFSTLNCVSQTIDDGFVMTGYKYQNGVDVSLVKTDSYGSLIWSNTYNNGFDSEGYMVEETNDGGYIVLISDWDNIYLKKVDNNGNEVWEQNYGNGESFSMKETTDNGFIFTGQNGNNNVFLTKTDNFGNIIWTQDYMTNYPYSGSYSIQLTSDGGYVICGYVEDSNQNGDILLIKTNQFGNITSTFEIPLPNPKRKLEKTINLKGQEIKPQTNQPIIEIFDDGSVEKKIIVE